MGEAFGPDVGLMIAGLPLDDSAYVVRTGFVKGNWGIMVVAAGPVTPFTRQAGKSRDAVERNGAVWGFQS